MNSSRGGAVALVLLLLAVFTPQARAQGQYGTVSGDRILDPSGHSLRLRGFNLEWWVPVTDQDASDIQALGANCVRYMFGYNPKGTYDPTQLAEVERQIRYFTSRGIWVIPVLYEFEVKGRSPAEKKTGPWSSPEMNDEFLALWTDLLGRLKGEPYLAAWEPINEPHDVPAAVRRLPSPFARISGADACPMIVSRPPGVGSCTVRVRLNSRGRPKGT